MTGVGGGGCLERCNGRRLGKPTASKHVTPCENCVQVWPFCKLLGTSLIATHRSDKLGRPADQNKYMWHCVNIEACLASP